MELTLKFETEAFRSWSEDIIRGMDKKGKRDALRVMAFDFLGRVIKRTPVDKGRARGGWASYLIANGVPVSREGVGWKLGVTEGQSVERFTGAEASITLINAVPYIVFLEFGSSRQAPAGMVRITMREMRSKGVARDAISAQLEKTVAQANRRLRAPRIPG